MYHLSPGNSSSSLLSKEMDNHLIVVLVVSHLTHTQAEFSLLQQLSDKQLCCQGR